MTWQAHTHSSIVVQSLSCVWLWPMDSNMPGFTVLHHLLELVQTHIHFKTAISSICYINMSQWYHPTILYSVVPFSSCLQCFPASVFYLISQLFTASGQSIGASASVLPMNIQDWFPLEVTGLIFLHFKGLSRDFSNTTIKRHWFFGAQTFCGPNLISIHWLLEKP